MSTKKKNLRAGEGVRILRAHDQEARGPMNYRGRPSTQSVVTFAAAIGVSMWPAPLVT